MSVCAHLVCKQMNDLRICNDHHNNPDDTNPQQTFGDLKFGPFLGSGESGRVFAGTLIDYIILIKILLETIAICCGCRKLERR